jgi:hypothetical protein
MIRFFLEIIEVCSCTNQIKPRKADLNLLLAACHHPLVPTLLASNIHHAAVVAPFSTTNTSYFLDSMK